MESVTIGKPAPGKRAVIAAWLRKRWRIRYARDGQAALIASGSVTLFGLLAVATAIRGMPTGLSWMIDMSVMLGLTAGGMYVTGVVGSFLLSLLYIPLPRRLVSLWLYATGQTYIILYYAEIGVSASAVLSIAYTGISLLAGLLAGSLSRLGWPVWRNRALALVGACLIGSGMLWAIWNGVLPEPPKPDRTEASAVLPKYSPVKLNEEDPSLPGEYDYSVFSYASGSDKHRSRFGSDADEITEQADASAYIEKWPSLKSAFWGFDEGELPVNGQVWMPEGEGSYPLALIVHGNHLMEYFSDEGYDYLGELLASRGIIAVSVDENFLNYSVWSDIPDNDMKLRAWMLLKHLEQIKRMSTAAGNPFHERVDWSSVALIGHSRGGQAAAMAADGKRWFENDPVWDSVKDVEIQSVISIAPTDRRVDDLSARLEDINYLTIQGARDGDVNIFYGDRQYNRTGFGDSDSSERFKASVYIADANHSQFNTDWGLMDERMPGGLLLNRKGMLKPEEQRRIAEVYISAFLETTLLGNDGYKGLFQDYRSGADWLPDTVYWTRYESADFVPVADFERESRLVQSFEGRELELSEKQTVLDRDGNGKGTSGVMLQWTEEGAEYEIRLEEEAAAELGELLDGSLLFSLMNIERELVFPPAKEQEADESKDGQADDEAHAPQELLDSLPPIPDIEIVIVSQEGEEASLPLAEFMPVQEPVYTQFMISSWLDRYAKNNKYKNANEPVFQTYIIPMELFRPDNGDDGAAIQPHEIDSIVFRFNNGPGKLLMDDIGFIPQGGQHVEYEQ